MNITINKCPIPIIWMDTNVIIDITKYRQGIPLKGVQMERIPKLNDVIYQKTREHKLIYAEGDQREEINSLIKEAHSAQSFLSIGTKFKYRKMIHERQLFDSMKSYINKENHVELNYKDAFRRDPITQLEEKRNGYLKGLIISVHIDTSQNELIERERLKEHIVEEFEAIRQRAIKSGTTYDEQLDREHSGLLQACHTALANFNDKIQNGLIPTKEEFDQLAIFTSLNDMWEGLNVRGFGSVFDFLCSDDFKLIPYEDIQSRLYAKIMTSIKPIESGDSMDIQHLSTVIPYCNYVITDKKMKNRIIELGIDKKYNTKVYCLSDIDEILGTLEQL
ncbi:hypothetical protein [Paenibacillus agricola]|uniref:DUF4935 domain-containing protein n=1 Tax=Paenibacillus agricola TaxID=2716264 RepID=A0ABX0IYP1_9BACL|nr:hypothetical protein [Paenibacillus agricola]NHN28548.1 hypothetical protein [Paenibacillus agricola]